ncbi:phosphate acyltransferase PlsX [Singulisphaera acidiphila]|uniref:Phosphate acyltransferase n=1 Tax=Singulisphaera acidiphila (strain ATCC BAA-1392 / DSM 18658 / VKM B-2454 / MOB10) TaxID=886293 RepID=L0DAP9_SINAD|nr:phosphate acyltransferase PlsX [Singulisphaera acidiphila]AGA25751.1 fatty acid/phospholipid synthesis protein PlsX [Singulisphaera acidiphila DSM 18658]
MRIALDAMGGDHAPGPIVAGAVEAVHDQPGLTVVLVGDRDRIEAELAKAPQADLDRLPIVHASQVVGMEEKPVEALRKKRDNSISKCWGLMATGDVKAVVSAGNTGAMVGSALFNNKMFLPGVRRPGIAAIFPSHQGPIVLIDVGANMNAKAEDLYQYGVMGSIYAETILGVSEPKIGLLNVGTEDDKGTDLTKSTRAIYQKSPLAHRFIGNVEGRDIYEGHAHVVVCEGFVGNVLLKAGEGAVDFLFATLKQEMARLMSVVPAESGQAMASGLSALKSRFEYQEFGGAPLLGIRGACIICHGASGDRAIKNAIRVASTMADDKLNALIVEQIAAGHIAES